MEVDVDVDSGRALERVEIALEEMPTGAVRFLLRTEDGEPVRRAKIRSMLDGELRQGSVTANSLLPASAGGAVRIGSVTKAVTHEIEGHYGQDDEEAG